MKCKVRMYRLERLGDCFLIQFEDGNDRSNVLIDCGAFNFGKGVKERINLIADDITAALRAEDKLNVIVGTHQHQDHLSGFVQAKVKFDSIPKDEVWLCWLDDPGDQLGKQISKDKLKLQSNLLNAFTKLSKLNLRTGIDPRKENSMVKNIRNVLSFETELSETTNLKFNAADPPKTPLEAINNLKNWGKDNTKYLSPGESFFLPGLIQKSVRVHVLGPPRNVVALRAMNPDEGESYDRHLTENALLAEKMSMAIEKNLASNKNGLYSDSDYFPFNPAGFSMEMPEIKKTKPGQSYLNKKETWRKIDNEWLGEFEYLSLFLNTYTNNSSLVLAFEFVQTGKVMLFAADAQSGNWKSWERIKWKNSDVTTSKLLANTVLYKVGHHCSHNATYVKSFEEMNHPELVAMIPVDEKNAKAQDWKMPAKKLYMRIMEKTKGRVIRMDKGQNKSGAGWSDLPEGSKVKSTQLYIDYTLGGL